MASYGQYYYQVFNELENKYESSSPDFTPYKNIVKSGETWRKLGIQAPPGTRFYLNNNKTFSFLIGKSGVYEIEDVFITGLEFLPEYDYEYNEEATNAKKNEYENKIADAQAFYKDNIQDNPFNIELLQQYQSMINEAAILLQDYHYGVYTKTSDIIPIYNLIIDYLTD